jgi:hypothetical protein
VKVDLGINQNGALLTLIPENPGDQEALKKFATMTRQRPHQFTCRGFEYLKPEVDFVISGPSRSSD